MKYLSPQCHVLSACAFQLYLPNGIRYYVTDIYFYSLLAWAKWVANDLELRKLVYATTQQASGYTSTDVFKIFDSSLPIISHN